MLSGLLLRAAAALPWTWEETANAYLSSAWRQLRPRRSEGPRRLALNTTLFGVSEWHCAADPRSYISPVGSCYSPSALWPGDPQWGEFDILDTVEGPRLNRSFFASTDGSCNDRTDGFDLDIDGSCIGPFGPPRPFGTIATILTTPKSRLLRSRREAAA